MKYICLSTVSCTQFYGSVCTELDLGPIERKSNMFAAILGESPSSHEGQEKETPSCY